MGVLNAILEITENQKNEGEEIPDSHKISIVLILYLNLICSTFKIISIQGNIKNANLDIQQKL